MPTMNGIEELAQLIQADPSIPELKLIFLTAFDQRIFAQQAREVGFVASLTKPIRQSVLLDTIFKAFANINRARAALPDDRLA